MVNVHNSQNSFLEMINIIHYVSLYINTIKASVHNNVTHIFYHTA